MQIPSSAHSRTPAGRRLAFTFAAVLSALFIISSPEARASDFTVRGSVFEQAGREYNVDPLLLFSIAVVESAVDAPGKKGFITPSPWTLRTSKPIYSESREDAEKALRRELTHRRSIDVGMMQINTLWHGHRVKNLTDLLDPLTNVRVGAQIISELISKYPKDAAKAIGSYHSSEPYRSVWYARHVLRVYSNLKEQEL